MNTNLDDKAIIPTGRGIGQRMAQAAKTQRCIFFSGLPGVGKSLFLQQQTLMAANAGRRVHLMQWDISREAFETPESLQKYPEIDGFTHAGIRKAVGLWARDGIARWHTAHPGNNDLLIGEVPIVGNRFVELVQSGDDAVESLLAGPQVTFFVPVPSAQVRERIESARAASIAKPKHEKEARDAPINVVQENWETARQLAVDLGIAEPCNESPVPYSAKIYADVFSHLLQHRNCDVLDVDEIYPANGSVYDIGVETHEIAASLDEVVDVFAALEARYTAESLNQSVERWYDV
ncbi:hypothetical protein ACVBEJ_00610 [Porticoccus sp. GXU_MW_L64]